MSPGTLRKPYEVLDQPHSKRSKIKIICAGAGATGLYLAYRVQKRMKDYELIVYEKNVELGGTWFENRYPGCACDVPSHIYTYTFRPNPKWSSYYASSAEILQYFKDFRDEFDLDKYIRYSTRISKARWLDHEGIYEVDVQGPDGKIRKDWCHVFINATGVLNTWAWPDIPGRETFKGEMLHSAAWNESTEWKSKRVAIIGTGSSAIQITPKVQKTASHLTVFIRSPTWIAPQLGGLVSLSLDPAREGHTAVNDILLRGAHPFTFTEEDKRKFAEDPEFLLELRRKMEGIVCGRVEMFRTDSDTRRRIQAHFQEAMEAKLKSRPELAKKLIPDFPPGCRRLTPGEGYLEALVQDNCSQVYDPITEFTPNGIKTADGKEHNFDLIICATGFNVAFTPSFEVVGREGTSIQKAWDDEPNCYLGIAAPGFPNYFISLGPRGPWGNGSIVAAMEINTDYFITVCEKMQAQGIKSIEVTQEATDEFAEHVDTWHQGSVWGQNCRSWYKKNRDPTSKPYLWAGMSPSYFKTMLEIRYEDYKLKYKNANRFAYLGNGKVEADYFNDGKERLRALTEYIRNDDRPWKL